MSEGKKIHFGYFSAKYLPALKPLVDHVRSAPGLAFPYGTISIEPHPEQGVYLVAVGGHATAIIHDKEGHIDEPVTLDFPDAAFEAARMPQPIRMQYENAIYETKLPEWSHPQTVFVSSAGTFILPKMRYPSWQDECVQFQPCLYQRTASVRQHTIGHDYRMTDGRPRDWRKMLREVLANDVATASEMIFDPAIPALFEGFSRLFGPQRVFHTLTTRTGHEGSNLSSPVILRFEKQPEFIGVYMSQTFGLCDAIPQHFYDIAEISE
ncbi:hypothetical protein [Agrobacterium sp. Azo12]|uniref:hypothetical protein n=1 Tax=Agrobacterium sp. Azo12 TaxID=3031129 RepID=UPI0023D7FA26|nr:hypothetical protein [Agrobacterium sp. Azo12]MDO5895093.1 hypothetical protein [Agrobacterium sp. Azo12]